MIHINGSIELNGTTPVLVKIPDIKMNSPVNLTGFSREMTGTVNLGLTMPDVGFELKSSSDKDKGVVVYFIVREPVSLMRRS